MKKLLVILVLMIAVSSFSQEMIDAGDDFFGKEVFKSILKDVTFVPFGKPLSTGNGVWVLKFENGYVIRVKSIKCREIWIIGKKYLIFEGTTGYRLEVRLLSEYWDDIINIH